MADRVASVNSYVVSPCGQQALNCGKCVRPHALHNTGCAEPWSLRFWLALKLVSMRCVHQRACLSSAVVMCRLAIGGIMQSLRSLRFLQPLLG